MSDKKPHSIIALGTFDGVHLGHQYLLKQVLDLAQKEQLEPIIVTFFPHPSHVLTPQNPLKLINSIDERVKRIKSLGIENVYVQSFTKKFSQITAEDFVVNTLLKKLQMKMLLIGYDHSFGKDKEGNFEYITTLGEKYGFKVVQSNRFYHNEILINSTHIRKAINKGDFDEANDLLGYEFSLYGKVIQGNQLGRKIGFNTANIALDYSNKIIPKTGVYIVKSKIGDMLYYGMMNIGYRPTVDGKSRTIEVHFFNLDQDLYYQRIKVKILYRLRDELKFNGLIELKKQLSLDKAKALDWIDKL